VLASAQRLAVDDPHQFQHWITLKLGGYPWMGGKKGGDKGVDGYFYYIGEGGATETGVISVKAGGNVNPNMVRDIGRVMARDGHKLGLFVTATLPTQGDDRRGGIARLDRNRIRAIPRAPDLHAGGAVSGAPPQSAAPRQRQPQGGARGDACEPHAGGAGQFDLALSYTARI